MSADDLPFVLSHDLAEVADQATAYGLTTWTDPREHAQSEAMVVDPAARSLYVAQADVGIWRVPVPFGCGEPQLLDKVTSLGVPSAYDEASEESGRQHVRHLRTQRYSFSRRVRRRRWLVDGAVDGSSDGEDQPADESSNFKFVPWVFDR